MKMSTCGMTQFVFVLTFYVLDYSNSQSKCLMVSSIVVSLEVNSGCWKASEAYSHISHVLVGLTANLYASLVNSRSLI